jgi:hypothetical protein
LYLDAPQRPTVSLYVSLKGNYEVNQNEHQHTLNRSSTRTDGVC